ncbi:hypothetical protein Bca4012_027233 [Brassica carinata]
MPVHYHLHSSFRQKSRPPSNPAIKSAVFSNCVHHKSKMTRDAAVVNELESNLSTKLMFIAILVL